MSRRRIILCSASPARRRLLEEWGFDVDVRPLPVDEGDASDADVGRLCLRIARKKADAARAIVRAGIWVTADTLVECLGEIAAKPHDRDDARRMLRLFRDAPQTIASATVVGDAASGRRAEGVDLAVVRSKLTTDAAIEAYLDTGAWKGKSGAYGVERPDDPLVEFVSGDYSTVVGLSRDLFFRLLRQVESPAKASP